jgi:site-specific recombinase XerD
MTTTTTTTAIVPFDPVFADPKRLALGGFLAGYSGLTRDAYELDLRQFVVWCDDQQLDFFEVRRADIEAFARELERRGRARATVARRLCTVTSFYRYAEEERLLAHSPAVHVRRPRIDYESHATGLDRNEVGALLVAAGWATRPSMRWCRCWRSTAYACRRRREPTSTSSASNVGIGR